MTTITRPMIIALADVLDEPLQISGRGRDFARHVHVATQRALLARKLVSVWVGDSLAVAVPVTPDCAMQWHGPKWLVITDIGRLVVSAYCLGCDHAKELR
jgi:hypothetical protein